MSPDQDIDHAISAASLVLAVLAALYTLWLGEVTRALDTPVAPDKDNRGGAKTAVRRALLTKAAPLFAASLAAVAIMAPRSWFIAEEAVMRGWRAPFNDVKAFFMLTAILLGVLCWVAGAQLLGLRKKGRDLEA